MKFEAEAVEAACRADLGVWAELKLQLVNAPFHWEWCDLAMTKHRLAVVAPREHAKTQVFSVNQTCWRCRYTPGFHAFVFTATADLAKRVKSRIDAAMWAAHEWMMEGALTLDANGTTFANGSRVDVSGAGRAIRGIHPDLIVGDDVLDEDNTLSSLQRKRMERWWFGTVGGMAHPGTVRTIGDGPRQTRVELPPTRVHFVGTPFHSGDLLMGLRENPIYGWRRYSAEFEERDLVPDSWAVEVA